MAECFVLFEKYYNEKNKHQFPRTFRDLFDKTGNRIPFTREEGFDGIIITYGPHKSDIWRLSTNDMWLYGEIETPYKLEENLFEV